MRPDWRFKIVVRTELDPRQIDGWKEEVEASIRDISQSYGAYYCLTEVEDPKEILRK